MERLKKIQRNLQPSNEEIEKLEEIMENVINALLLNFPSQPILSVGSVAKGTFLSGTSDLDIFIKFHPDKIESKKYIKDEIVPKIFEVLGSLEANPYVNYASHPYVKGIIDGISIDICPCCNILDTSEIVTAVDRTPFHTEYIIENLRDNQKNEVRLLKRFLKVHNLYGANEKVQGFSGYLCELLIIKYGTFLGVLESELEDEYLCPELCSKKSLIGVEDPVDPKRNVAAALSLQKYGEFVFNARSFLKEYEEGKDISYFFEIKKESIPTISEFKRKFQGNGTCGFRIRFLYVSKNEEVLYSKARKYKRRIQQQINDLGFKLYDVYFWINGEHIEIILEFEVSILPKYQIVEGPSFEFKTAFEQFKEAHKGDELYMIGTNIVAKTERKFSNVEDFLKVRYPYIYKI